MDQQVRYDRILQLAQDLRGFEIVPGLAISMPTFDRNWITNAEQILHTLSPFPSTFRNFLQQVGALQAIDVADGVAFFTPKQILHHLAQDYGPHLSSVNGVTTFPFAANGSGEYLLLAYNDSGVWKFSAHMALVAKPQRLSDCFEGFLDLLIKDWQAMLDGKGGPYLI